MRVVQDKRFLYFEDLSEGELKALRSLLYKKGRGENAREVNMLFYDEDRNQYCTYFGYLDIIRMKFPTAFIQLQKTFFNKYIDDNDLKQIGDFELRDYQINVVKRAIIKRYGTIVSAVGSGKTIMMAKVSHYLNKPTLIIAPDSQLVEQLYNNFLNFGVWSKDDIGLLYAGEKRISKITIGTFQSVLAQIESNPEEMSQFKIIHFEEGHTTQQSESGRKIDKFYENIADYILGWTGSPYRRFKSLKDFEKITIEDFIVLGLTGKPIVNIPIKYLVDRGYLAKPIIYIEKINSLAPNIKSWHRVYKNYIEKFGRRNQLIAYWTEYLALKHNIPTMVLVNTKNHAVEIFEKLPDELKPHTAIVYGNREGMLWGYGRLKKTYIDYSNIMKQARNGEIKVIIATQVFNTGTDIPELQGLILAFGGKSYIQIIQRIGRVLRKTPNKDRAFIIDFYDNTHPYLKAQSIHRLKTYKEEGFDIYDDSNYFKKLIKEEQK